MAGIMKSVDICRLPAAPKVEATVNTVEIETDSKPQFNASGFTLVDGNMVHDTTMTTEFACEYRPARITRTFDCEYPDVSPNVARTREAIPFPKTLKQLIAWTDVFVDRIAAETKKNEEDTRNKFKLLYNEIKRLEGVDSVKSVTISQLEESVSTLKVDNNALQLQINALKATVAAKDEEIKHANDVHKKEVTKLQNEQKKLNSQLNAANAAKDEAVRKLSKDLAAEHKLWEKEHASHLEDHNDLAKQKAATQHEADEKLKAQKEVAKLAPTVKAQEKQIKDLTSQVGDKDKAIGDLKKNVKDLGDKLKEEKHAHEVTKQSLQSAKNAGEKIQKQLDTAHAEISKAAEDLKKQQAETKKELDAKVAVETSLKETKTALENEKKDRATDISKLKAQITHIQKEGREGLKQIREERDNFRQVAINSSAEVDKLEAMLKAEQDEHHKDNDDNEAKLKAEKAAHKKDNEQNAATIREKKQTISQLIKTNAGKHEECEAEQAFKQQ